MYPSDGEERISLCSSICVFCVYSRFPWEDKRQEPCFLTTITSICLLIHTGSSVAGLLPHPTQTLAPSACVTIYLYHLTQITIFVCVVGTFALPPLPCARAPCWPVCGDIYLPHLPAHHTHHWGFPGRGTAHVAAEAAGGGMAGVPCLSPPSGMPCHAWKQILLIPWDREGGREQWDNAGLTIYSKTFWG